MNHYTFRVVYDADDPKLKEAAQGIITAIRKHGIPWRHLSDEGIFNHLKRAGYNFPIDTNDIAFWFNAIDLADRTLTEQDYEDTHPGEKAE